MSVLNLFLRGSTTLGLAAVLTATASAADLPVKVISGFVSPESVIHDPDTDEYLVSNVGGSPVVVNRGFISPVSPDGEGRPGTSKRLRRRQHWQVLRVRLRRGEPRAARTAGHSRARRIVAARSTM